MIDESEQPQVEEQMILALRRISRSIDLHSRVLVQQRGLTAPQLAALQVIDRVGTTSVGDLARAVLLSQATVTGIVARLDRHGFVTRRRAGNDRRSVVVELTPSGREVLNSRPSLLQHCFQQRLRSLQDWERSQILTTLQRIAAMMESPWNEPCTPAVGEAPGTEST